MIRPVDSDDEQSQSDEDDGRAVAVKEDPQFTLAVTRGLFHRYICSMVCLHQKNQHAGEVWNFSLLSVRVQLELSRIDQLLLHQVQCSCCLGVNFVGKINSS